MDFRFDCVFYYVSDLDRAIRFYTENLKFRLLSRDEVARFDVDGVLFELVPDTNTGDRPGNGNARLCLKVEDVRLAVNHMKAKRIHTSEPQIRPGGVLASFDDPDGNEICLWEYREH